MRGDAHRIRILLVDDHPAVRRGLRHLLEAHSDMQVIGEAADAAHALHIAGTLAPDAVVMDVHLGRDNGFDVGRQLRQVAPAAQIIMLTDSSGYDGQSRYDGVYACLLKADADERLVHALRRTFQ